MENIKELADHTVLATLTEEEVQELRDLNAKKQGADHIAREMAKIIGETNNAIDDWFNKVKAKYGIDYHTVYINTPTLELRKGRA